MTTLDQYIHAATRDNTRESYRSAIRHFEIEWGGFLPATADSVARYLVAHAETLALNTLRHRLAALAQWHIDQGFPDPTKAPVVRQVLRGIQALHPAVEKRAKPLQLEHRVDDVALRAPQLRCRDRPALGRRSVLADGQSVRLFPLAAGSGRLSER